MSEHYQDHDQGPVEEIIEEVVEETLEDNETHHEVEQGKAPEQTSEQLGEKLKKVANDAAYAAVGFADLLTDKAKSFYEDQKRQYIESHPDAPQGAAEFLGQLGEKLDKFVEDVAKGYKDLAERGRARTERQKASESAGQDVTDQPVEPEESTATQEYSNDSEQG